jgi:cytochrome P450
MTDTTIESDGVCPAFPMRRETKLDPPPEFSRWRAQRPLHRVKLWDGREAWAIVGYDAVRQVIRDHETFVSSPLAPGYPTLGEADEATKKSLLLTMIDPPLHTTHRSSVLREFTVKAIEALRPDAESIVFGLLDAMKQSGSPVDLVSALGGPVPAQFTCRLLGAPYEDADYFTEHLGVRFSPDSSAGSVYGAEDGLREYFADLVDDRLKAPQDDLTSRLVTEHVRTGELTRKEAATILHILLIGGFDTTKQMITLGTLTLFENPDQLAILRANPSGWRNAVEEMLRYITMVQSERRACVADTVVAGQKIRAGDGLLVMLSSANRDESVFDSPETFDVERKTVRHLAFGSGVHQCLGQAVARLLLHLVFPNLFEQLPDLRLAVPFESLSFRENRPLFGVDEMLVEW